MQNKEIREIILKAAYARFGYYGFAKTTMAEIAGDCSMSAANIYRHFSGKNDIIAEIAIKIFSSQEAQLAQVVAGEYADCSKKLHDLFQAALRLTYQYKTEQPKMKEMVDYICQKRFDLVQAHKEIKRSFIEDVLKEGCEKSEFTVTDLQQVSLSFLQATVMFHTPLYMEMQSQAELVSSCRNVVDLLLCAILIT